MALYVLFKNENTLLCIHFICLLFKLQMCQIILADPVQLIAIQKSQVLQRFACEKKQVVKNGQFSKISQKIVGKFHSFGVDGNRIYCRIGKL